MKKIILLSYFISFTAIADQIKPFTTDGCSMFPDDNMENHVKWMQCCIHHDYTYQKGGTEKERKVADLELKECVAELGEKYISSPSRYLLVRHSQSTSIQSISHTDSQTTNVVADMDENVAEDC